jgi:hypothetical protein
VPVASPRGVEFPGAQTGVEPEFSERTQFFLRDICLFGLHDGLRSCDGLALVHSCARIPEICRCEQRAPWLAALARHDAKSPGLDSDLFHASLADSGRFMLAGKLFPPGFFLKLVHKSNNRRHTLACLSSGSHARATVFGSRLASGCGGKAKVGERREMLPQVSSETALTSLRVSGPVDGLT